MKILFAEDDRFMLKLVAFNLRNGGHEVSTVEDGHELLKKLESDETYDLVITDNNMPKMKGIDVLDILRVDRHKSLPVIVYTSDNLAELRTRVEPLGGVLVGKTITELLAAVNAVAAKIAKEKR